MDCRTLPRSTAVGTGWNDLCVFFFSSRRRKYLLYWLRNRHCVSRPSSVIIILYRAPFVAAICMCRRSADVEPIVLKQADKKFTVCSAGSVGLSGARQAHNSPAYCTACTGEKVAMCAARISLHSCAYNQLMTEFIPCMGAFYLSLATLIHTLDARM